MSNQTKRKNVSLTIKATILLLALVVMIFVGSLAWFSSNQKATADGISVIARGDGVEVSWDGKEYFDNLTAKTAEEAVDGTGYAKNLCDDKGNPTKLRLVTGNGLRFFEPNLNRRLGTTLLNSDGSWNGIDITPGISEGRYIDLDLHFRSTVQRDVYLAGNSTVSPKNPENRNSEYGYFSKDHIAAASRVAFLNSNSSACSYIWAPNADTELIESKTGYERIKTVRTAGGGQEAGDLGDVIDFTTKSVDYYLWLPDNYSSDPNTQASHLAANKMTFTVYDKVNNKGLYTCDYTITEPNTGSNPTILYYINKSGSSWNSNDISYVDVSKSNQNNDSKDSYPKVALANTFNLNNTSTQQDRKAPAFYIEGFKTQVITIKIGYNPETKEVIIIGYSSTGAQTKTYNRAGEATDEVKYYEIENNANCVLVNPDSSVAVSSNVHNKKAVYFMDNSTKMNVTPVSVTVAEQFTAIKTGDGYEATYKFQNVKTGEYLNVTDGKVSCGNGGSDFSFAYKEGMTGPLLKTGEYVIVVQNGEVLAVKETQVAISEIVTVFTGVSYELIEKDAEKESPYQYYNSENKRLETLNSTTNPKLFYSTSSSNTTNIIGDTTDGKIVTLTKEKESDPYYTAHIVMRIWVEGTDREAKTPLAGGIFDVSLQFVSQ